MATYKGINGFAVQSVASDPSPSDEGQVWYNNATYAFKLAAATTVGTWASGGALNTGRGYLAGCGLQTAAVAFGGFLSPGNSAATELYNGTSWTSSGNMGTARYYLGSAGTQTAALGFGGYAPGNSSAVESFNGTSWSPATSMPVANRNFGSTGTQTAAIAFGGVHSNITLLYNAPSWSTNPTSLNTYRVHTSGVGTQTAALGFGGQIPGPNAASAATESFNGSTWTTLNSLNTARKYPGGSGTQTSALAYGGGPPNTGATELWNGTSWTSNPNSMGTARYAFASAGTQTLALASGGRTGSNALTTTEEWIGPGAPVTQTITTS